MEKAKILFEIIVDNNCNKRCSYCKIGFYKQQISYKNIDKFIDILSENLDFIDYLKINFFGGEPLLGFEKIKYFVKKAGKINHKILYSIGTNGLLLDEEKIFFFNENNFKIYLSIDLESKKNFLEKKYDFVFENLFVNFVITPDKVEKSDELTQKIIDYGVNNINILPALGINSWNKNSLKNLQNFYKKYYGNGNINLNFYSYFNGFGSEKQFILETDGNIYQDLDSLIWIQRQNISFDENIKNFLEKSSFLGNIYKNSLKEIVFKYNKKNILRDIFLIAKYQDLEKLYMIIDKIFKG